MAKFIYGKDSLEGISEGDVLIVKPKGVFSRFRKPKEETVVRTTYSETSRGLFTLVTVWHHGTGLGETYRDGLGCNPKNDDPNLFWYELVRKGCTPGTIGYKIREDKLNEAIQI